MTSNTLTIAPSKGRIFEETLPLLTAADIVPAEEPEGSRKLIIGTNRNNIRLVVVRATDVPTYVQYGAADLGIAGRDVLIKYGDNGLYRPLDSQIAKCHMIVAVRKGFDYAATLQPGNRLRIATKYPDIVAEHFTAKDVHVDIIKLYSLMGLAPLVGLSDAIVDLVSIGNTLKASDLEAVEYIADISSRLMVNKAAPKTKRALLEPIIQAFGSVVSKEWNRWFQTACRLSVRQAI